MIGPHYQKQRGDAPIMNDISSILSKISDDAREYERKLRESSQAEVSRIEADYQRQAQAEREGILAEARAQAEALNQRALSQAGIEERNRRLTARRGVIDAVFSRSLELLRGLPKEKLMDLYASQAVRYVTADAALILCPRDRDDMGRELAEKITGLCRQAGKNFSVTLAEEAGSFLGGFVLRQGSIETNCTFEVLNMSAKEELEARVAEILFS